MGNIIVIGNKKENEKFNKIINSNDLRNEINNEDESGISDDPNKKEIQDGGNIDAAMIDHVIKDEEENNQFSEDEEEKRAPCFIINAGSIFADENGTIDYCVNRVKEDELRERTDSFFKAFIEKFRRFILKPLNVRHLYLAPVKQNVFLAECKGFLVESEKNNDKINQIAKNIESRFSDFINSRFISINGIKYHLKDLFDSKEVANVNDFGLQIFLLTIKGKISSEGSFTRIKQIAFEEFKTAHEDKISIYKDENFNHAKKYIENAYKQVLAKFETLNELYISNF